MALGMLGPRRRLALGSSLRELHEGWESRCDAVAVEDTMLIMLEEGEIVYIGILLARSGLN